jgi:hypothetical protein
MIIVQLTGGLGNQMFQYACGKYLACKMKTGLVMDTRFLNISNPFITKRNYELGAFAVKATFLKDIPFEQIPDVFTEISDDIEFTYNPDFAKGAGKNIYLKGYWQSWKYFQAIEPLIKKQFIINHHYISEKVKTWADRIRQHDAVCVHIRRTDYTKPQNAFLGVLPLSYYCNAIRYIIDQKGDPVFYIFSDEPEWCMGNLKIDKKNHIIQGNTDIEDLYLMTRCKHHIIANSTYSWWGAWLNPNPNKTVITPDMWLLGSKLKVNETDLVPPDWISLTINKNESASHQYSTDNSQILLNIET